MAEQKPRWRCMTSGPLTTGGAAVTHVFPIKPGCDFILAGAILHTAISDIQTLRISSAPGSAWADIHKQTKANINLPSDGLQAVAADETFMVHAPVYLPLSDLEALGPQACLEYHCGGTTAVLAVAVVWGWEVPRGYDPKGLL